MSKHPFEYQRPTREQAVLLEHVRSQYRALYETLMELPSNRERSVAITNLETSNMWANKSVVFDETNA